MRKFVLMVVAVSAVMASAVFGQDPGVVWTEIKGPFSGNTRETGNWDISIAWGKDKFVAVGGELKCCMYGEGMIDGKVAYSLDGVTWTVIKDKSFNNLKVANVAWIKDKFVVYASENKYAYSSDGMAWMASKASAYVQLSSVVWNDSKFVGNRSGCDEDGCTYDIVYSSDGVTWTNVRNHPFTSISTVACDGNKFIAGGSVTKYSGSGELSYGKMAYSSDGITWTEIKNHLFGDGVSVFWGCNKFVAGGRESGNSKMAYSSDGVTWTEAKNYPFGKNYYIPQIVWGGNRFVASIYEIKNGALISSKMVYSSDGITWTEVKNHPLGKVPIRIIVWGGNKFVALGGEYGEYSKMAYSPDGIAWTEVKNRPFGKKGITNIFYGNGVFVAASKDGRLAYSK